MARHGSVPPQHRAVPRHHPFKTTLTRRPRIWLMAADSFKVHSATILGRISFMYNIKAFKGFLIWTDRLSSRSRADRLLRCPVPLIDTEFPVMLGLAPWLASELKSDWEWGGKDVVPGVGGEDRRPPPPPPGGPPHLDKGLLQWKNASF